MYFDVQPNESFYYLTMLVIRKEKKIRLFLYTFKRIHLKNTYLRYEQEKARYVLYIYIL